MAMEGRGLPHKFGKRKRHIDGGKPIKRTRKYDDDGFLDRSKDIQQEEKQDKKVDHVISDSDAYHSVRISEKDRKYLRFYWNDVLYENTCLQNGLTTAPRIFTKILKVVFSKVRSKGHCNTPYIDDSLLVSKTFSGCQSNIIDTVQLLDDLGFTIHPDKFVLQPTQINVYGTMYHRNEFKGLKMLVEKSEFLNYNDYRISCLKQLAH
ncbi:Hypothetical predicted protein [Mytilus galloprovincialis]|uniref:Reverse transcriptase domain-containing protein n=1 Tax=Mytilus galloprovincialis TaxID=29158 RepID=A0A8B6DME8_MYTGA|nr:Hypothetical predicted protein [Mytilus galloprovincialis]